MKKTFKKVLAVILAMTVLAFIPVIAFAADGFSISSASIKALSGTWKDDYVERVQITLEGDGRKLATDGAILTVGTNDEGNNMMTVMCSDVSVSFSGKNTVIEFNLNQRLDHGTVYNFVIKEGAFASARNIKNDAYKISVTGNALIETVDVTPYDVPHNPIYKFINWMEEKNATLFAPIIFIIKFFLWL